MTTKEAIEDLLLLRDVVIKNKDSKEALSLAISALEENEKLKAEMEMCIKLPCKIGDTLYEIDCARINEITVVGFGCGKNLSDCDYEDFDEPDNTFYVYANTRYGSCGIPISQIGKNLFIARSEAEKALEGMNHEN